MKRGILGTRCPSCHQTISVKARKGTLTLTRGLKNCSRPLCQTYIVDSCTNLAHKRRNRQTTGNRNDDLTLRRQSYRISVPKSINKTAKILAISVHPPSRKFCTLAAVATGGWPRPHPWFIHNWIVMKGALLHLHPLFSTSTVKYY